MAKDALIQVRLNTETKERAEKLYERMGISLSEAVRIFIAQSITDNGLPFDIRSGHKLGKSTAAGCLSFYQSTTKREKERQAWIDSLKEDPNAGHNR